MDSILGATVRVGLLGLALSLVARALVGAAPALAEGETIIFLHHSCGQNLIAQGGVREGLTALGYEFYDHGYNEDGLVLADGTWTGTNFDVPDDNTDPDGYAAIFAQPLHDPPDNTFSYLMQYDLIAFKSCFPVSNIESDAQLEQYRADYLSIRSRMDQYPEKIFVIVTQPPELPAESSPDAAARARSFANWLQSDEYLSGHPNVFVFDFFGLLAGGDDFLRPEYRSDEYDAHPNELANRTIGPLFVEFLDTAMRSYGGSTTRPLAQATSSPEAAVPVEEASMVVLDSFEGYAAGGVWDVWTDGGATTLECVADTETAHAGDASLLVQYSIAPEGWAGCGRSYHGPQNWGAARGLSMWILGEQTDVALAVTLQIGDPEAPTPFQAELTVPEGSGETWAVVELPWETFSKPDWFGEGGEFQFDPGRVVGVSFDLSAVGAATCEGRMWVDDLGLMMESQKRISIPLVPGQEAPAAQGGECAPTGEEGRGGAFPCPALALPLMGLSGIFWRRGKAYRGRRV
jgi:hypothetical protein